MRRQPSAGQARIIAALGLDLPDTAKEAYDTIADQKRAHGRLSSAVFSALTAHASSVGKTDEWALDKCPFCDVANSYNPNKDSWYLASSFNSETFFCFSCRKGCGMIDLGVAFFGEAVTVTRNTLPTEQRSATRTEGQKRPWSIEKYLRWGTPYDALREADKNLVEIHFVERGLNKEIARDVINECHFWGVRYRQYRRNKREKCLAIVVPTFQAGSLVRGAKRRLLNPDPNGAPKWAWLAGTGDIDHLYPNVANQHNTDAPYLTSHNGPYYTLKRKCAHTTVLVENQLEALILNHLADKHYVGNSVTFLAKMNTWANVAKCIGPLTPHVRRIVLAFDADQTGRDAARRDKVALARMRIRTSVLRLDEKQYDESASLCDVVLANNSFTELLHKLNV